VRAARAQATETGGREATTRRIPPKLALAVGMPTTPPPKGWSWAPLTDLARLESGHTPSRKHPEYWGGAIPWISLQDARDRHGQRIQDTVEHTNEQGIANSSARVLPANTVCLSRTASVGYVVVMGQPMATSQDFVNWVCTKQIDPRFLQYLFIAEGEDLLRFASGAIHQTIYFPEVKAFHVAYPPLPEQQRIVAILDEAFDSIGTARANAEKNLQNARALYESAAEALFSEHRQMEAKSRFGDLAIFRNGINFTKSSKGERVRIVGVKDFKDNYWAPLDQLDMVTTDGALSDADLVAQDDLLFVRSNGNKELIGRCLLIGEPVERVTHSGFTIRARLFCDEIDPRYLCHFMRSATARREVIESGVGTNIKSLNQGVLAAVLVPLPPRETQESTVEKLKILGREGEELKSIYEQKLKGLEDLKRSILHRAFTGNL
jgi:type I restriction enzyme S subunit